MYSYENQHTNGLESRLVMGYCTLYVFMLSNFEIKGYKVKLNPIRVSNFKALEGSPLSN